MRQLFTILHPKTSHSLGFAGFSQAEREARKLARDTRCRIKIIEESDNRVLAECRIDVDGKVWTDMGSEQTNLNLSE
jgi:hypothetical protein